jgi:hypothetical protein
LLIFNKMSQPEEASASESASEISTAVKLNHYPRYYPAITRDDGIRSPFGVIVTPKAAFSLIGFGQKV